MKNYLYGFQLKERGYVEVNESEYTDFCKDMKNFIDSLSMVIKNAKCGWDGVAFKVMKNENEACCYQETFMVLHCDGGERWIPISGNSKGCNFSVLGENLW